MMVERKSKHGLRRQIVAKINKQKLYDPNIFLSPKRIDLAAKTVFARAYLERNRSTWPEEVYREHIRAFNNFYEEEPRKTNYEDFKDSFTKTIEAIKESDDWKHHAPVRRNGNYLINGAHRTAASIVLGDKVNTIRPNDFHEYKWDYQFFKSSRGEIFQISENVLDYITIEYVSLKKKNIFVAIIFPTAEGFREEAYEHLLKLGEIVNMKTFKHDEFVGKEVIKQLYFNSKNDEWNYGLDFNSANHKAKLCFDGSADLQVYVIEANLTESTRIREKKYLRSLWDKDKHSIHITDTIEEANRVARMFFNENSRKFMKINRKREFSSQKMYDMFNEYINLAPRDIFEREKVAIEGSAVLDLLNIRDGKDIDYISWKDKINFKSINIEKHDQEENSYHSQDICEILTNPNYYFYYKGYKFIDIVEIRKYKLNRAKNKDEKDIKDIKLINNFLRDNPQYEIALPKKLDAAPLVSVIIPVYNTPEIYLIECLESIRKQRYHNLEIIIIDDGSAKRVAKTIDNYISNINSNDNRWTVVHQKNMGLAGARNSGYKIAQGKYVQFLDADDYFDERLIERAVEQAEATGAEIVVENFRVKDYVTEEERTILSNKSLPSKKLFNLKDLSGNKIDTIPYNVWSKLFNKEFLEKHNILHDEELMRTEDVLFTCSALLKTQKISFVPEPYITYRENLPSSNSKSNDKFPSISIESWNRLRKFMKENNLYDEYRSDYEKAMLNSLHWHFERLYTEEGRKKFAEASASFFKKIEISIRNDFYIQIEATAAYPEVLHIFDDKDNQIQQMNEHLRNTRNQLEVFESQVHRLEQPSMRLALRKLAGAIRRKMRRTFNL